MPSKIFDECLVDTNKCMKNQIIINLDSKQEKTRFDTVKDIYMQENGRYDTILIKKLKKEKNDLVKLAIIFTLSQRKNIQNACAIAQQLESENAIIYSVARHIITNSNARTFYWVRNKLGKVVDSKLILEDMLRIADCHIPK